MIDNHLPTNIERILEAATLAPSNHNSQPWKFVLQGEEIHLFPDFERSLPVGDPEYRELIISLGCALENLAVAARHEGFAVETRVFPQELDGIIIRLRPMLFPPDPEKEALFEAIGHRQTTRSPYDGQPLAPEILTALEEVPMEYGVHLRILTERRELDKAATLVRKADEFWMTKPSYRKEQAKWTRFSLHAADTRRDGLTSRAIGHRWMPEWFGRLLLRHWVRPSDQAREDVRLVRSASAVLLFYSTHNEPASWIAVGRSFERLALTLTRLGLKYAPHNQPCEIPAFQTQFRKAFGPEVVFPQLLLRVGYADEMPRSPRRNLGDVVM